MRLLNGWHNPFRHHHDHHDHERDHRHHEGEHGHEHDARPTSEPHDRPATEATEARAATTAATAPSAVPLRRGHAAGAEARRFERFGRHSDEHSHGRGRGRGHRHGRGSRAHGQRHSYPMVAGQEAGGDPMRDSLELPMSPFVAELPRHYLCGGGRRCSARADPGHDIPDHDLDIVEVRDAAEDEVAEAAGTSDDAVCTIVFSGSSAYRLAHLHHYA